MLIMVNFNLLIHHNKCYIYGYWLFSKARVIIGLLFVFSRFINNFNENNFEKYIINCPFTFNSNITIFNEYNYQHKKFLVFEDRPLWSRIQGFYNIHFLISYKHQLICTNFTAIKPECITSDIIIIKTYIPLARLAIIGFMHYRT